MAATILNSDRAAEMSVFVVRAFVQLREYDRGHGPLLHGVGAPHGRDHGLERKVGAHDRAIADIIDAIRQLMAPPAEPKRLISLTVVPKGGSAQDGFRHSRASGNPAPSPDLRGHPL